MLIPYIFKEDYMSKVKPIDLKQGAISKKEYNKRKTNEDNLKGNKKISKKAPKYLDDDGEKIYKNIVNSLPDEFLNNTDEYVVAIIADSIAKMQQCQEIIKEQGLLVKYTNSAGATNIDQNKAILIYQKYNEIFKKYIGEIGLSPSARGKLAMLSGQENDSAKETILKVLNGNS